MRRDWTDIVLRRLNDTASGHLKIAMGSPGSAQVTRCRLLADFNNIEAETDGANLHIYLNGVPGAPSTREVS